MTTDRQRRPTPARRDLPDDDLSYVEEIQALQGEEMPDDQDAVIEPDEMERRRRASVTEIDHGAAPDDPADDRATPGSLDGLAIDGLREGETDDPIAAAEEGLTYVPPSDPPVQPADQPGAMDESELTARIRDALRSDAATAPYADELTVATIGSRAVIRGSVDGIEDTDLIAEVVGGVEGIDDVVDETTITAG
jgi:BON domain